MCVGTLNGAVAKIRPLSPSLVLVYNWEREGKQENGEGQSVK